MAIDNLHLASATHLGRMEHHHTTLRFLPVDIL